MATEAANILPREGFGTLCIAAPPLPPRCRPSTSCSIYCIHAEAALGAGVRVLRYPPGRSKTEWQHSTRPTKPMQAQAPMDTGKAHKPLESQWASMGAHRPGDLYAL